MRLLTIIPALFIAGAPAAQAGEIYRAVTVYGPAGITTESPADGTRPEGQVAGSDQALSPPAGGPPPPSGAVDSAVQPTSSRPNAMARRPGICRMNSLSISVGILRRPAMD